MDIFAHGLWSYAIFRIFKKDKYAMQAALFGILPDLIAFGPFFIYYHFILGNDFRTHLENSSVFLAYSLTHSLIIFLVTLIVIYIILKKVALPLLAWGLHIIIDIPTHTREFYPTPMLWPLSDYTINGISWANKWFMIINYSLILLVYIFIFYRKKQMKD